MNRKYACRVALSMLVLTAAIVAVDALVDHMTDPPEKFDSTETISLTEEITMPWRMGADEKYVLERYAELTEEAAADHVILTDENYGGMYYDDDGYAVICVKTDSPSDTYADIIDVGDGMNQIAIREVKYSRAELDAVREDIRGFAPHLGDYLIIELRIRDTENKIQVGIDECEDIEHFTELFLAELGLDDSARDMFDIFISDLNDLSYLTAVSGS
ncbi:MAG TPA: hypothetical protein H9681_06645 [Firmicutes bacterium]|nr:hypothetical protein [Bacillota bacterium]